MNESGTSQSPGCTRPNARTIGSPPGGKRRLCHACGIVALSLALLAAASQAVLAQQETKGETAAADGVAQPKVKVSKAEELKFDQSKAAAEMAELEARMFRLSEALRKLEPENSSRLSMALKFARKELIQHQMSEIQSLLIKLDFSQATDRQKDVLEKLQRLHELLLSTDLDFQLQLERLRLLREVLKKLDTAIKEEQREVEASKKLAEAQKQVDESKKRRADLIELVKRQAAHVEEGEQLAKGGPSSDGDKKAGAKKSSVQKKNATALGESQKQTRQDTQALANAKANSTGEPSQNLSEAEASMGQAVQSLAGGKPSGAVPQQRKALTSLKKELQDEEKRLAQLEKELAKEKFLALKRDQQGNRKLTEGITESVRKLGESGASSLAELGKAGNSMSSAEGQLGNQQAGAASGSQQSALKSLEYAKQQLEAEAQKMLSQLRREVHRRVIEGLTVMLEKQVAVRKATQTLTGKVSKESRKAMAAVVGLANSEGEIIDIANELLTIIEETEFGIALPAALRVVGRSMVVVQESLETGDASEEVVARERQIEDDLKSLLEAMQQMPPEPSEPRKPRKGNPRDRARELNKLIAELKLIRFMQVRVNGETVDVDGKRPEKKPRLSAAIRRAIEAVEEHQDEVFDATDRLIEERFQELMQQ